MTSHPVVQWAQGLTAEQLLPGRSGYQPATVPGPFTLLDALELAPGSWVAVVADASGARYPVPLASLPDGALRRARAGDGVAQALTARLSGGPAPGFTLDTWHSEECAGERSVDVDQTNDSVVVGERAVVKWSVRTDPGPAPAAARIASLARAGFSGMPRPWGMLRHGGALVATVTELLPGAEDGWQWLVSDVGAYARGELSLEAVVEPARSLGALAARMHRALPRRGRADADLAVRWHDRAQRELTEALGLVHGMEGDRLSALAGQVTAGLRPLAQAAGTPLIDAHGDLHVGQVLRWRPADSDQPAYAVTDFDGNPVLPPEQRVEAQPAAADVAGLLQSLEHAALVVLKRVAGVDTQAVRAWSPVARAGLLDAYRTEQGDAGLLDESLLRPLRLRQVVREHLYAAQHLPRWSYVPHAALPALLGEEH
jgi:maltokinase